MQLRALPLTALLALSPVPALAQPSGGGSDAAVARVLPTEYRRPAPAPGDLVRAPTPRAVPEEDTRYTRPFLDSAPRFGPARLVPGVLSGALVFGLLAAFTVFATRRGPKPPRRAPASPWAPVSTGAPPSPSLAPPTVKPAERAAHPGFEVRRVTVALDWRFRSRLQGELQRASNDLDYRTPEGLHAAATAARDLVAGAHASARCAAFQGYSLDAERAWETFGALAEQLRGRSTAEAIANAREVAASAARAPSDAGDGEGLVVVTLLLAVKGALPELPPSLDLPSLMNALQTLVPPRKDRIVALEVSWTPSDETDRLTTTELGVLYPELLRLDAQAAQGRRVCGTCRGVYPVVLGRCPACGATAG